MSTHRLPGTLCVVALAALIAVSARSELATWDQARVTDLANELVTATDALYETFTQQPKPEPRSIQSRSFYRLEHRVWMLRVGARMLVDSLEEGEGREPTLWMYDTLMSHGRSARYEARDALVAAVVSERAAAVRAALNNLGPYYDPDFQRLAPDPSIEPTAAR